MAGGNPNTHGRTRKEKKCKTTSFTLGTWNVQTLLDNIKAERPEQHTALVTRELVRYNIDVAALSETCLPGVRQLSEKGYTFFWSGHREEERKASPSESCYE